MRRQAERRERGSAAVEFALVAPVLILLIIGMVELGRAYNAQISLSGAAREGARVMAVENDAARAREATAAAAPSLNPRLSAGQVTIQPSSCSPGMTVSVTAEHTMALAGEIIGPLTLTGKGVMRCGG